MMSGSGFSLFSGKYRSSSMALLPTRPYSKSFNALVPGGRDTRRDGWLVLGCARLRVRLRPVNKRNGIVFTRRIIAVRWDLMQPGSGKSYDYPIFAAEKNS